MALSNSTDRFNGVLASLAVKAPCVAVADSNITLSGTQTVGSVAVVAGDRVLVTAQTNSVDNGIYDVSSSAWTRAADFDGNRDVTRGTLVTVNRTTGQDFFYQVTTANPITIGVTAITFLLTSDPNVSYPIIQPEIDEGLTTANINESIVPGFVERYGPNTTPGTTDMQAPFVTALGVSSQTDGPPAQLPDNECLIGSAISLDTTYDNVKVIGGGTNKSKLTKGFNGDLMTLTDCSHFEMEHVHLDGQHGTFTGKGLVFSGAGSTYPRIRECYSEAFTDSHIEFGADAGQFAKVINTDFWIGAGQGNTARGIHCAGTDTTAQQRQVSGIGGNCHIDLDGALATDISGGTVTRVEVDSACSVTIINDLSWSNSAEAMTLDGSTTIVLGCRFSVFGSPLYQIHQSGVEMFCFASACGGLGFCTGFDSGRTKLQIVSGS